MLPPPPAADAGGVLLRRALRSGPHHYPRLIYSGGGGGGGGGVGVRSTGTGYFPPPTFCFPLSVGHAARLGSARREIEEERKKKRPRHAAPGRCKNKRNGSSRAVCVAYSRRAVRVCVCVCRCQWIRHGTGRDEPRAAAPWVGGPGWMEGESRAWLSQMGPAWRRVISVRKYLGLPGTEIS